MNLKDVQNRLKQDGVGVASLHPECEWLIEKLTRAIELLDEFQTKEKQDFIKAVNGEFYDERFHKLIDDAIKGYKENGLIPKQREFVQQDNDKIFCCGISSACLYKEKEAIFNSNIIMRKTKHEYNLTDDEVWDFMYGFDEITSRVKNKDDNPAYSAGRECWEKAKEFKDE